MTSSEIHIRRYSNTGRLKEIRLALWACWEIALLLGISQGLVYWSIFWNSCETEPHGTVKDCVGEQDWYKVPIALHQISLCQSSICLWICLESIPSSTICSWLSYHLTIYPLSSSLPWALPPPVRAHPLFDLDRLSLRSDGAAQSGRGGDLPTRWCSGPGCAWERPSRLHTELGGERVAEPEPYCAPGGLMAPQIILMPFVWKLFVEASHVPVSHAKCWASPKLLCLLHSPLANCAGRWGALNANEGNGWHARGTGLGTPPSQPLLLRSLGNGVERLLWEGDGEETGSRKASFFFSESHSFPVSSKAVQFLVSIRISNPVIVSLSDLGKFLWRVSGHLTDS